MLAASLRRADDELIVVLSDDEQLTPDLGAALLAADEPAAARYTAARRVRFLGRDIQGESIALAWRGGAARQPPAHLPGAVVTTPADVATIVDRLEAIASRGHASAKTALGDLVGRPLIAVVRRLWLRRRDGIPGVILSMLETFGEVLRAAQAWEHRGVAIRRAATTWKAPSGFHDWRTPWGWLTLRDGTSAELREAVLDATPDLVAGERLPGGRGTVWALSLGGEGRGVLRWYRRGGAFRRLLGDRYFGWSPRPMQELGTTEEVRRRGVAVPEVLAARVDRLRWGWYRGAIVTRELAGALTFAEVLRRHPAGALRSETLTAVGRAVRDLHDRGVHHRDLNAANILVTREDALQVWFIDFDRAVVAARVGRRTRARAFRRLERSLAKLAATGVPLSAADTSLLAQAYREAAPTNDSDRR